MTLLERYQHMVTLAIEEYPLLASDTEAIALADIGRDAVACYTSGMGYVPLAQYRAADALLRAVAERVGMPHATLLDSTLRMLGHEFSKIQATGHAQGGGPREAEGCADNFVMALRHVGIALAERAGG